MKVLVIRALDWLIVLFPVERGWNRVVVALLAAGLLSPFRCFNTAAVTTIAISPNANKLCKYWDDPRNTPTKQFCGPAVLPLHPFILSQLPPPPPQRCEGGSSRGKEF